MMEMKQMSSFCRLIRMFMVQQNTFMKNFYAMVKELGVFHFINAQWSPNSKEGEDMQMSGKDEKLILKIVKKTQSGNVKLSSVRLYLTSKLFFTVFRFKSIFKPVDISTEFIPSSPQKPNFFLFDF